MNPCVFVRIIDPNQASQSLDAIHWIALSSRILQWLPFSIKRE